MPWNTYLRPPAGADDAHEQNKPDPCRGRFIVPTADLSALYGCSINRIIYLICIIVPSADLSARAAYSIAGFFRECPLSALPCHPELQRRVSRPGPTPVTLSRSEGSLPPGRERLPCA